MTLDLEFELARYGVDNDAGGCGRGLTVRGGCVRVRWACCQACC